MKKGMLIFILLIFALISLSCAYAGEVNDTAVANPDDPQIELSKSDRLSTSDDIQKTGQTDEGTIAADDTSFAALEQKIKSGNNITLDYDYKREGSEYPNGIIINKSITIDGKGHTIDGSNNGRIFQVTGSDVVFKNITFINGRPSNRAGGAVYFSNSGAVINCNFADNTGSSGGAIYFSKSGNVENCNFTNNVARDGGAVYFNSNGAAKNCNFIVNRATFFDGGAIYFNEDGTAANCNFTANTASNRAGAIYFGTSGSIHTITDSKFTNNTADWNGGAVYFNSLGDVENCNFTDNKARRGGAVYFDVGGAAANCNFTNNKAIRDNSFGGALYFNKGNSSVTDSVFINNSAGNFSAVHLSSGVGNIFGCLFINNSADFGVVGQAWDSFEKMNINNNIFLNNNFILDAIDFAYDKGINTDGNWFGNTADNYTGEVPCQSANVWLFLNATCKANADSYDTVFKLYAYNKTTGNITDYDNSLLKPVSLTITQTNGDVDKHAANLGETIVFKSNGSKTGSVTASVENVAYTIEFETKANPNLSVESQEVYYSNNTVITLNYNSTATGKVNVTLKGKNKTYNFTDMALNAAISLGRIIPDGYNITVTYSGDENFINATAKGTLTVNPIVDLSVNKTSDRDVYFIGDEAVWTITVHNAGNGTDATKVYLVDDFFPGEHFEILNWTTTQGTFKRWIGDQYYWEIGDMANGTTATLKIFTYAKSSVDEVYNFAYAYAKEDEWNLEDNHANKSVAVKKINSKVNVNDTVINYGETAKVTVTTEGASAITAKINGKDAKVDGFTIEIPELNAGTYTLSVTTVPDENHTAVTEDAAITVNKLKTKITAKAVTATYKVNKNLVITLKDAKGNPISGAKVTVSLKNSKTYTTNKNGQIKVSTKGLVPKTYTAKITFNGNTNYAKSTKNIKVTVKKATPKIAAKKKTFKTTTKTKKYAVALKDNTKKPIKKATLTLKVGKKTYKAKTNSKGKATFNISKLNKKGNYKATITYKGNKYYNKAIKKSKITVKLAFKTVSKGSKDKKTVKKIQKALKDNGYYLSYQGSHLMVDGIFESCTERSVKEFQKDHNLKVTGKVEEKTAKKLKII